LLRQTTIRFQQSPVRRRTEAARPAGWNAGFGARALSDADDGRFAAQP